MMDKEKLKEAVRGFPCLWKVSSKDTKISGPGITPGNKWHARSRVKSVTASSSSDELETVMLLALLLACQLLPRASSLSILHVLYAELYLLQWAESKRDAETRYIVNLHNAPRHEEVLIRATRRCATRSSASNCEPAFSACSKSIHVHVAFCKHGC